MQRVRNGRLTFVASVFRYPWFCLLRNSMKPIVLSVILLLVGTTPLNAQAGEGCYVGVGRGFGRLGVIIQFDGPLTDMWTYCDQVRQAYTPTPNPRAGQFDPSTGMFIENTSGPTVLNGDYFQRWPDLQALYHLDCGQFIGPGEGLEVYDELFEDGTPSPSDRASAQKFCVAMGAEVLS